jgi:hypothetical protein
MNLQEIQRWVSAIDDMVATEYGNDGAKCELYVLYADHEKVVKEKDDLIYVYQNTPFAHWHERALKAEEQIAALKAELEWFRYGPYGKPKQTEGGGE